MKKSIPAAVICHDFDVLEIAFGDVSSYLLTIEQSFAKDAAGFRGRLLHGCQHGTRQASYGFLLPARFPA